MPVDEPYLWAHLTYHLVQSGRSEELRELLFDFSWLEGKLRAMDVVTSVDLTSNEHYVLSGSHDGTVRMWDLETGGQSRVLAEGHRDGINVVAVSTDGERMIFGGIGTLEVIGLPTGEKLQSIDSRSNGVGCLAVAPGRGSVFGANEFHDCLVEWDLSDGRQLDYVFYGSYSEPTAVAVTPDCSLLIAGAVDGTIKAWDVTDTGLLPRNMLLGHTDREVMALATTPDNRHMLSAESGQLLKIWDLEREQCRTLPSSGNVRSLAVASDGQSAVSGHEDGTLKIWNLSHGSSWTTSSGGITAVAISPGARQALVAGSDGNLLLWDVVGGKSIAGGRPFYSFVKTLQLTFDGRYAIASSNFDYSIAQIYTLRMEGV